MTNHPLDGALNATRQAVPLLNRASHQLGDLAHDGLDAVRHGSEQVRDSARKANKQAVGYIRQEPVKSMLLAAAAGAVLMALVGLASRSRDDR